MENQEGTKKKKFYKRWWFWTLAVLALFVIIGASSNSTPQKVGQNTVAASTNQPAPSSAPQTFKVGDQVQLGDSVLTVNKVQVSQGGEFIHPSAGDEYINLNITIQNNGSSGQYVTTGNLSQLAQASRMEAYVPTQPGPLRDAD